MKNILIYIMLLMPFLSYGQEQADVSDSRLQIRYGIAGAFTLNLPGNWMSTNNKKEISISYGGAIGAVCNATWKSNWFAETGLLIGYDNLKVPDIVVENKKLEINRWTAYIPIEGGYYFDLTETLKIAPVLGIKTSCSFGNHVRHINPNDKIKCNPLNIAWGIGVNLLTDQKFAVQTIAYMGLVNILKHNSPYYTEDVYVNSVHISIKYYL